MVSGIWLNMSLGLIITILGLLSISSNRKHLLATLLSLEMSVLGLFLLILGYNSMFMEEGLSLMVFLTLSVCEGSLGLSILVSMVRSYGNDYLKSLTSFK